MNKIMKSINSNIKSPSLRFIHWNKGNSLFYNIINDFQLVIDKYKPHIISLSEANYCNVTKISIPEYNSYTRHFKEKLNSLNSFSFMKFIEKAF